MLQMGLDDRDHPRGERAERGIESAGRFFAEELHGHVVVLDHHLHELAVEVIALQVDDAVEAGLVLAEGGGEGDAVARGNGVELAVDRAVIRDHAPAEGDHVGTRGVRVDEAPHRDLGVAPFRGALEEVAVLRREHRRGSLLRRTRMRVLLRLRRARGEQEDGEQRDRSHCARRV